LLVCTGLTVDVFWGVMSVCKGSGAAPQNNTLADKVVHTDNDAGEH